MHRLSTTSPLLVLGLSVLLTSAAWGQMEELAPIEEEPSEASPAAKPDPNAGPPAEAAPVILEEFELDERDVVLSAARTRTTIQEAPGIITVITAEEIRQRGHRTINDVLRTVPGFEGGRLEANGWFDEAIARGQPRTLLILVNGVNVTEPVRNSLSLDRKIPIDAVKRVEVTSGPGGVLWGSNALLGVVNIILKDASDLQGVQVLAGGGHGSGAQGAIKGGLAYGDTFLDDGIRLFTSLNYYSDTGAELETDASKVLGVLPEPALDGITLYEDRNGTTDFNSRDYWISSTLSLQIFDEITVDWLLQFERDHRQIATGGALLAGTRRQGDDIVPATVETVGDDSIQTVGLTWRRRLLDDRFGINAKVYGVRFTVHEDPFWAFPPRALPGITALDEGVIIGLNVDELYRYGTNLDFDLNATREHHLLFGVELFQERLRDGTRSDVLRNQVRLPGLRQDGNEDPNLALGVFGPERCPPPGTHDVQIRERNVGVAFGEDCRFTETLLLDTNRSVAALYVSDEWRAAPTLTIQPGYRVQISNEYDPVSLFGGALVWNLVDKVFLKLNYAEGFRPPSFEGTKINAYAVSQVSFESDANLRVEQSRAGEAEINAVLFEDVGALKRVYLRGDFAYTVLTDVVRNQGGQFVNSGERGIHSVEFLARADFDGGHEVFLGGHFTRTEDSISGPVRNFPNWVFMGGGRARLLGDMLELSAQATYIGPQEDLNRPADLGSRLIDLDGNGTQDLSVINASDLEVEKIDAKIHLRLGFRVLNLWEDRLEISGFAYNIVDTVRLDPDFFFDDRVASRPQPREGWSAFGQATVRFF